MTLVERPSNINGIVDFVTTALGITEIDGFTRHHRVGIARLYRAMRSNECRPFQLGNATGNFVICQLFSLFSYLANISRSIR